MRLSLCTYPFVAIVVFSLMQTGCFFHGGVSTVSMRTHASGAGFLAATERNGQWETDGPPPDEGDVTDRPLYRNLKKNFAISIMGASSGDYELSELYPSRRYRIAAIREVGTSTEGGKTVHYYEVEFTLEKTP